MTEDLTIQIMWSGWNQPLLEHMRLSAGDSVRADGLIIGMRDDDAFRVRYAVGCDSAWHVREVDVRLLDDSDRAISLRADGAGHWRSAAGAALSELTGCIDVDIAATPFTNTLPIKRLGLSEGQEAIITVVYISIPDLNLAVLRQRYACLDAELYRYENLSSGYTADLPVDADGIVIDYPEQRRRVWARRDR